ncbi:ArnT family glycosyltransferase [Falsigemmobacter intermedius]|uniref:ArnT family glycosyltransferase n=1 Tax=Falsigemmobacter intermedius TaxID=1553448 RepID=UPI003F0E5251
MTGFRAVRGDQRALFRRLMLIGIGLRLIWAIAVPVFPVSDSEAYDQFARTLAAHGVYGWSAEEPTAYWAVGTSALVAFTYLFTESYLGVVALNLIAGVIILALTFHLASRWFGESVGLLALGLVAFWPNLIFFTSVLSSELFFIAGLLAGLVFWQRPHGHPVANLLLAGLIWGLTSYIRPVVLLVPVALALVDLVQGPRRFLLRAVQAGVIVLLIVLAAAPWSWRNQRVLSAPAMISTNFGANFWMGNNPQSSGGYMELPAEVATMSEIERNDYLKDQAKQFIREEPAAALRLLALKLVKLNNRETIGVVWNEQNLTALIGARGVMLTKIVATLYWYLLLAGAIGGMVVIAARSGIAAALFNQPVSLWGYFTALHVVVVAEDRYHMPSSPFIAVLAAVALHRVWINQIRKQDRDEPLDIDPDCRGRERRAESLSEKGRAGA